MRALVDTYYLTGRALREALRQPANEIGNLFIPLFFLAVTTGALERVSSNAFGVTNFLGFQIPVAVLQATASVAGSAGIGFTQDIQKGYFDKLLLTSASRWSIVFGRIGADAVKGMLITAIVVAVGLIFGSGFESGPFGAIVLVLAAGLFTIAYSGVGTAIALRTGSPQAAQAGFLLFFPLIFVAPTFAPKEVFSQWLEVAATINPLTYIIEALRGLVIDGWDGPQLAKGMVAIAGLGAFTLSLTAWALRWRTSS